MTERNSEALYQHLTTNVKYSCYNGVCAIVANNLITPFIPLFAIEVLKATHQQVALLSSLPALMGILALLPGARIIDRLARKKHFTGMSILSGRLFYLLIALVPFLPVRDQAAWLVILVALMNFPTSVAVLAWQAFIASLIPEPERNRFFGDRNRITTFAGLITTLFSGIILEQFPKDSPGPYQAFFTLAFFLALLEVYYIYLHVEPDLSGKTLSRPVISTVIPNRSAVPNRSAMPTGERSTRLAAAREILGNRPFIYFLVSSFAFHFGWQMAWPLFNIYQIENAHATAMWISIFTLCNSLMSMATFRLWSRWSETRGTAYTLIFAALAIASATLIYTFSMNLYYLAAANLWIGVAVAGITLLLFNRMLEVTPETRRATYMAIYQTAIGISGFIAPQVGVWIMNVSSIYVSFYVATALRSLGAGAFAVVWLLGKTKAGAGQAESFNA
ncbi:MAG: MFS transporter [Firmicutes bacterium]|nr:MFS transporter [Bacillota bacterium]